MLDIPQCKGLQLHPSIGNNAARQLFVYTKKSNRKWLCKYNTDGMLQQMMMMMMLMLMQMMMLYVPLTGSCKEDQQGMAMHITQMGSWHGWVPNQAIPRLLHLWSMLCLQVGKNQAVALSVSFSKFQSVCCLICCTDRSVKLISSLLQGNCSLLDSRWLATVVEVSKSCLNNSTLKSLIPKFANSICIAQFHISMRQFFLKIVTKSQTIKSTVVIIFTTRRCECAN